jgi:prevent-host-death family protein
MVEVNVHEAKTHLSRLLVRAAAGEEVLISRAGKPVARLVAVAKPRARRVPDRDKHKGWIAGDFDAPLPKAVLTRFLSAASAWEIAIKVGLGKLKLPEPPARYVPARLAEQGMDALPIDHGHALRVAELPDHHADPFDRLLVAQAQLERMTLMTADPQLLAYEVDTLWAAEAEPPAPRRRRR